MKGDPNDGWTRVVSRRLSLGRLLPLGGAADGSWIAERAAAAVLIQAAGESTGLLLGATPDRSCRSRCGRAARAAAAAGRAAARAAAYRGGG